MTKTLHKTLAAVLLCGAAGLAAPALAATHSKAGTQAHHAKRVMFHASMLSGVDRMERHITAELNRSALKTTQDETAAVIIPNTVASTETDDDGE